MDTHLLRTFVTVVRTGTFSAAADELGYTQAAVSQQIASLENDLKVTLLHRRPVRATDTRRTHPRLDSDVPITAVAVDERPLAVMLPASHRTELLHPRTTDAPGRAFMAALTGGSL